MQEQEDVERGKKADSNYKAIKTTIERLKKNTELNNMEQTSSEEDKNSEEVDNMVKLFVKNNLI